MNPLGKPLVFYLQHFAEMEQLCGHSESDTFDTDGLYEAERVRKMAPVVGVAATANAVGFLKSCGNEIQCYFEGLGASVRITKILMAKRWVLKAEISFPSIPNAKFTCGVSILSTTQITISMSTGVCGVVFPWIRVEGESKGEDAVCRILGSWPHSRSGGGLAVDPGTVALACIPIKAQPEGSFDVYRDPLIAEVIATFARIDADQAIAIATYLAGLKPNSDI